jgi:hypothetical protein
VVILSLAKGAMILVGYEYGPSLDLTIPLSHQCPFNQMCSLLGCLSFNEPLASKSFHIIEFQ